MTSMTTPMKHTTPGRGFQGQMTTPGKMSQGFGGNMGGTSAGLSGIQNEVWVQNYDFFLFYYLICGRRNGQCAGLWVERSGFVTRLG